MHVLNTTCFRLGIGWIFGWGFGWGFCWGFRWSFCWRIMTITYKYVGNCCGTNRGEKQWAKWCATRKARIQKDIARSLQRTTVTLATVANANFLCRSGNNEGENKKSEEERLHRCPRKLYCVPPKFRFPWESSRVRHIRYVKQTSSRYFIHLGLRKIINDT